MNCFEIAINSMRSQAKNRKDADLEIKTLLMPGRHFPLKEYILTEKCEEKKLEFTTKIAGMDKILKSISVITAMSTASDRMTSELTDLMYIFPHNSAFRGLVMQSKPQEWLKKRNSRGPQEPSQSSCILRLWGQACLTRRSFKFFPQMLKKKLAVKNKKRCALALDILTCTVYILFDGCEPPLVYYTVIKYSFVKRSSIV
uniref:Uncharacterized protein n=1 Tax=Romanomermis culicivorax TaxID=13658 RepID=A0A915KR78_ROMCU